MKLLMHCAFKYNVNSYSELVLLAAGNKWKICVDVIIMFYCFGLLVTK